MNINAVFLDKKIKHLLGIDLFFQLKENRFFFKYFSFKSVRRDLMFMTHRIGFPRCQYVQSAKNLGNILKRLAKCWEIVSTAVWRICQFTIATSDDTTFPPSLGTLHASMIHLYTKHPLCAIDIYGAIYILPNILSLGKWPQARAKLLNIQAGNEAKFVCVSARFRHWYTSGSSTSALLPDCILSRDEIILQHTVTCTRWHARTDLRSRIACEDNLTIISAYFLRVLLTMKVQCFWK